MFFSFVLVILGVLALSCAKRPVLYPNARYYETGEKAAQEDIDVCIELAKRHGADSRRAANVGKKTAAGAATGAVVGTAVGAVAGKNVGRGAAVGAAGAGSAGFMHGLLSSRDPDPILQKRFVEKCLRDKGYDIIGWK